MPIVVENAVAAPAGGGSEPRPTRRYSFTVEDASVTMVIGAAGAGKSTLLDLLAGLRELREGRILYDGSPLWIRRRRLNPAVSRRIGLVFQQPEKQLFAATVAAEFRYSLRFLALPEPEAASRIRGAMRAMKLPEALLARNPLQLSAGQKRRVALAATAATAPDWLLLDEPTAGLDPDGVRTLADWLQAYRKRSSCGIVVATHDLDTFLPMADRVLVLDGGGIAADVPPQELDARPKLLLRAGVGLPAAMELALRLRARGLDVPATGDAEEMADAIERCLRQAAPPQEAAPEAAAGAGTASAAPAEPQHAGGSGAGPDPAGRRAPPAWAAGLDPRGKWAVLLALSAGALMQQRGIGIAASALLALGLLLACRFPLRRLRRITAPLLLLAAVSAALAGLERNAGFSAPRALDTVRQLLRVLPALLAGAWFSWTTPTLAMKRGLDRALAPLARLRVPVDLLTLPAALTLRFIPLLADEFERFSRIARARGKSRAKPGRLRPGDLAAALVPFLLSCFQRAEQLALAVEARGYKLGGRRTSGLPLRMRGRDWAACAAAAAAFALLAAIR